MLALVRQTLYFINLNFYILLGHRTTSHRPLARLLSRLRVRVRHLEALVEERVAVQVLDRVSSRERVLVPDEAVALACASFAIVDNLDGLRWAVHLEDLAELRVVNGRGDVVDHQVAECLGLRVRGSHRHRVGCSRGSSSWVHFEILDDFSVVVVFFFSSTKEKQEKKKQITRENKKEKPSKTKKRRKRQKEKLKKRDRGKGFVFLVFQFLYFLFLFVKKKKA